MVNYHFHECENISAKAINVYPYNLRKEYIAYLDNGEDADSITFYATDDKNAMKFIEAKYNKVYINTVMRVKRTYTTIYNRE